jgi:DNA-binding CsgD family transcriptional regulator
MNLLSNDIKAVGLSRRELEVALLMIRDGATAKEIMAKLFVCEKTVKFHVTNIYRKAQVKNRGQLMARYLPALVAKELSDEIERLNKNIEALEYIYGKERTDYVSGLLPKGRK